MSYFDDIKARSRAAHPSGEWPGMARYAAMAAADREYLLSLVDEMAKDLEIIAVRPWKDSQALACAALERLKA